MANARSCPRGAWREAPRLQRIVVFVLAPRLVTLALPFAVLGAMRALNAVVTAIPDWALERSDRRRPHGRCST